VAFTTITGALHNGWIMKVATRGEGTRARTVAALAVLAGFDLLQRVLGIEVLGEPEGRRLLVKLLAVCMEE
jgi:hypothetical protein